YGGIYRNTLNRSAGFRYQFILDTFLGCKCFLVLRRVQTGCYFEIFQSLNFPDITKWLKDIPLHRSVVTKFHRQTGLPNGIQNFLILSHGVGIRLCYRCGHNLCFLWLNSLLQSEIKLMKKYIQIYIWILFNQKK